MLTDFLHLALQTGKSVKLSKFQGLFGKPVSPCIALIAGCYTPCKSACTACAIA